MDVATNKRNGEKKMRKNLNRRVQETKKRKGKNGIDSTVRGVNGRIRIGQWPNRILIRYNFSDTDTDTDSLGYGYGSDIKRIRIRIGFWTDMDTNITKIRIIKNKY